MPTTSSTSPQNRLRSNPQIWWSNTIFFLVVHLAAFIGICRIPPWSARKETLMLWFLTWQLADFGITIGYHRLYSHRAFRANVGVRIVLSIMGSCAFQGSIKTLASRAARCLRHRLHHRFTDDPIHDPYAATRGLFYSHMGWIFYKPVYDRLHLIEKDDLESDPVVRIQHKYYVPLALTCGFVLPTAIAHLWGDWLGGLIWGGLVARLFIWHCTFLVNSLAHWEGLQPYSDEDTSRGNLLLALLTGGEGNHNFHSFPHDFRSGPSVTDWDPSKWIIMALCKLGMVSSLRKARKEDLDAAIHYMQQKSVGSYIGEMEDQNWIGESWNISRVRLYAQSKPGQCIVLIDGFVVDATPYLREHPGGAAILRSYSVGSQTDEWKQCDWAFNGGMNNHSRSARRRMGEFRIAKLIDEEISPAY